MLSPLQRSGHSFTFIQVAHICSSGGGSATWQAEIIFTH